jgi:LysR substrate binding domain
MPDRNERYLIVPQEARLEMSKALPAKRLADRELILAPFPNALRRLVDELLVRTGKVGEPKIEIETNCLTAALIRRGVGYSVLPLGECAICWNATNVRSPIRNQKWTWVAAVSREHAISPAAKKLFKELSGSKPAASSRPVCGRVRCSTEERCPTRLSTARGKVRFRAVSSSQELFGSGLKTNF